MSLSRPTLAALQSRTQADITTRVAGASPVLRRGLFGPIITALAGSLHTLYGYLDQRSLAATPYSAVGDDRVRWASLWGVTQKQATAASGTIIVSGAPGAPVPAETQLQSPTGALFAVDADAVIGVGGTVDVAVTAATTGADGNQPAGAVLTFVSPLASVNAEAEVDANGIGGGADLEDLDSLWARTLDVIQSPAHGGSAADYVRWVHDVMPTARAWCFPTYRGPGSVRVYVVDDDYVGAETMSPADVTRIFDYINSDEIKPVGVVIEDPDNPGEYINGLEVTAPAKAPVDFTIDDVPDDPVARAKAEAAVRELFLREAVPEGSLALNKIIVAIGANSGLQNFTLTAPVASPSAGAGEILTVGTFTWL